MSSLFTTLGLRKDDALHPPPNQSPYHVIFHFFFAYCILSSRGLKAFLKLDHNVSPREDISKYGEKAVADGKITRRQLNLLRRNEAAHANSVEHFPFFVGSVLFATVAGVGNESINATCWTYGMSRVLYAASYLLVERNFWLSYVRSASWWASNYCCIWLLWESGKGLNVASM